MGAHLPQLESVALNHHATNPLLTRRLLDLPPIGGVVKQRPEDFLVEEISMIDPCGEGEHLHMGVQRTAMTHDEMIQLIATQCGVMDRAIGHAGMKDKAAITRQTLSVHLPGLPDPPQLQHERLQVMWTRRHTAKLRIGQLKGNRFSIRIRQVDPLLAPRVHQGLRTLTLRGVPNAFGAQRFGMRRNGHLLGHLLAEQRWDALLAELCGAKGSAFPEWQREARERFDAGDFTGSLPLWTKGDHSERGATRALMQGRPPRAAVISIHQSMLQLWLNATQSAGFNAVLDARIRLGFFDQCVEGDLANLHPGRSIFRVNGEMLSDHAQAQALQDRITSFDCSPTGPMIGPEAMAAEGESLAIEEHALAAVAINAEQFISARNAPHGERRSLRMPLRDVEVEAGVDNHGGYIRMAFDLPRGGYATALLAEIMGTEPEVAAGFEPAVQNKI